jgi:hypothetical protein
MGNPLGTQHTVRRQSIQFEDKQSIHTQDRTINPLISGG